MNWLVASLVALISWGVWGLFVKQALKYSTWSQVFVVSSIATLGASLAIFLLMKPEISVTSQGFGYSLVAGFASAIAVVAFYSAMNSGKVSIVVPLTALSPIVTVVLSYLILSERISPIKGIGVALAMISILLLSID
jgi:uncharacterized membrane protein